jgi:predicted phage terminase large subunit-like protein
MRLTNGEDIIALPSYLRPYGATDWATLEPTKGKSEPDFTEHGVWGTDYQSRLFALDWWSRQAETDKGTDAFLKLVRRWKPVRWFHEGGTIDKALAPHIRKEMRRTSTFTVLEALPSMADKGVKLQAFHSLVSNGMVYGPMGARWWEEVIDQLVKFPGGRWDDKADVCGLIGRAVDKMFDANLPAPPKVEVVKPFSAQWLEYGSDPKPKVRFFS